MAKQSGLHQIRGKVGEHSYYRQTGVESGLIRSINPGMSSRVKNDEAFANTRLNNAEFGQAGRIASILSLYITPKFRPMVLPFSQSKIAKVILESIKYDTTAPWGQRNLTPQNVDNVTVSALNSVAKNRFDEFGLQMSIDEEVGKLTCVATAETVSKLSAIGADGITLNFLATNTWIGTYQPNFRQYALTIPSSNNYTNDWESIDAEDDMYFNYVIRQGPPQGWPAFAAERTGVLILLPYRIINGTKHILQEHCTFKAFRILDGPVN